MESKMTCRGDETDHVLRCLVVADVFSPRTSTSRVLRTKPLAYANPISSQLALCSFLPVYHFFLRYKNLFSPTPHWIFALEFRIGIWICCNALSKDTES